MATVFESEPCHTSTPIFAGSSVGTLSRLLLTRPYWKMRDLLLHQSNSRPQSSLSKHIVWTDILTLFPLPSCQITVSHLSVLAYDEGNLSRSLFDKVKAVSRKCL